MLKPLQMIKRIISESSFIGICYPDVSNGGYAIRK